MATALVLASGRGTRLGGPKALLVVEGLPLARLHALRRSDCDRCIVVGRSHVLARLDDPRIVPVASDEPDELGPAGSIRAAVRSGALDGAADVLITPVDVLPAPPHVARTLLDALRDAARFERGHPVAIRGAVLREAYERDAPPLRDVLARLGDRCVVLPNPADVDLSDLDTADDVLRVTGAPPRFL